MPATVVVGAQWGDEGKGKVIDILAGRADMVVRSQGGNNAGHTVKVGEVTYKLRLVPSGILYKKTICVIGNGVVVDPKGLLEEMDALTAQGIPVEHLRIDKRAHVIMPYHIALDGLSEDRRGGNDIGTTKKGIGPCYMDKAERIGIRMCDLIDRELFAQKAAQNVEIKNKILKYIYNSPQLNARAIIEEYNAYAERLKPYVCDTGVLVYNAIKENKKVLFEGAQGTLLDIDVGTYPFVTSSHPVSGGVCVGAGIGPTLINDCVGVMKAYTTRVGKGPFPTELFDETGDTIREKGGEYGTVTGRPRRCGWFDSVIGRFSVRVNGLTGISLNKIDTMANLGKLKICTAYKTGQGIIRDFPASIEELAECEPIYEELDGFEGDLSGCRSLEDLPASARAYIQKIEELCGCPVVMVGIGPEREQNIEL